MSNILVIGAAGQLGTELVEALRSRYPSDSVFASDLRPASETHLEPPYVQLDALDREALFETVRKFDIDQIYHLAAILSARGEDDPINSWNVNMGSLMNVLDAGRLEQVEKIFWPSSIAVFGPDTPRHQTPQQTLTNPTTVYGISKVAGERWCAYYHRKYGVDIRSLRYPGLIGYKAQPGGGTTDYAVDIFFKAIREEKFRCFLKPDTGLPMMYMNDAVKATLDLMQAGQDQITVRSSYNISSMSFSPRLIYSEIRNYHPDFEIEYAPDYRQAIAETWPESIDDRVARSDWGWEPEYDLKRMTRDILENLAVVR